MSRIGRLPVDIPKGVEVTVKGEEVRVKGPKGELARRFPNVRIRLEEGRVVVARGEGDPKIAAAMHGMARARIAHMIRGVSEGYVKTLLLEGVGYRAQVQGTALSMTLGFSHPVVFEIPKEIKVSVEDQTKIRIEGHDKDRVGAFAAAVRARKPAEPYQGKGIRYEGEVIRRKAGKTAAAAGATAGGAK